MIQRTCGSSDVNWFNVVGWTRQDAAEVTVQTIFAIGTYSNGCAAFDDGRVVEIRGQKGTKDALLSPNGAVEVNDKGGFFVEKVMDVDVVPDAWIS